MGENYFTGFLVGFLGIYLLGSLLVSQRTLHYYRSRLERSFGIEGHYWFCRVSAMVTIVGAACMYLSMVLTQRDLGQAVGLGMLVGCLVDLSSRAIRLLMGFQRDSSGFDEDDR